jgi:hypothetical protein
MQWFIHNRRFAKNTMQRLRFKDLDNFMNRPKEFIVFESELISRCDIRPARPNNLFAELTQSELAAFLVPLDASVSCDTRF